jgi:hypothetical protein
MMLQRWLGTVLLYCEQQFKRVKGFAEIAQVIARGAATGVRRRRQHETPMGAAQENSTDLLTTSPGLPLGYALIRNPSVYVDTEALNSIIFSHKRAMLI